MIPGVHDRTSSWNSFNTLRGEASTSCSEDPLKLPGSYVEATNLKQHNAVTTYTMSSCKVVCSANVQPVRRLPLQRSFPQGTRTPHTHPGAHPRTPSPGCPMLLHEATTKLPQSYHEATVKLLHGTKLP